MRLFADAAFRQFKAAGRCVQPCRSANGQDGVVLPVSEVFASDHRDAVFCSDSVRDFIDTATTAGPAADARRPTARRSCGIRSMFRMAEPARRRPPPPVRRASLQAARRVGAPRPEAQPARARPQAGARGCAEPEEQGDAAQPVTAALLLRRVCRSRCGQADRIAVLQLFRFCADTLPIERCGFVLISPSYYIK